MMGTSSPQIEGTAKAEIGRDEGMFVIEHGKPPRSTEYDGSVYYVGGDGSGINLVVRYIEGAPDTLDVNGPIWGVLVPVEGR